MTYPVSFKSFYVPCKQKTQGIPCEGRTRLPLPNPLDIETRRINSPTENEPLIVLCSHCLKVSRYLREDFEEAVYPAIELSGDNPIYLIEIVCGEVGCEIPTRVYTRDALVLTLPNTISRVIEALDGKNARCPVGHLLENPRTQKSVRKIQERYEGSI